MQKASERKEQGRCTIAEFINVKLIISILFAFGFGIVQAIVRLALSLFIAAFFGCF